MISVGKIEIGNNNPLVLIAGPCVVEGREMILRTAEYIQKLARKQHVPFIFKASYKKANRTSDDSFAGMHMDEALRILAEVRETLDVTVLTDVHAELEAASA